MVCTFMLIVLPTLMMRACYAFWCWLTGKKPEVAAEQPAQVNAEGEQKQAAAAKGVCPYHVVLKFFGFKVPEKKQKEPAAEVVEAQADERVKAE